jgi:hypothetical protein
MSAELSDYVGRSRGFSHPVDLEEKVMEESKEGTVGLEEGISSERMIEEQGRDQTGQRQIRVRIDERNLQTSYVSGFRPTMTAEEVILDFGLNLIHPTGNKEEPYEMVFQASNRLILSYFSAKRLAATLAQIVRRYEQQFGPVELNAAKRRAGQPM